MAALIFLFLKLAAFSVRRRRCHFKFTRKCCVMPAASSWPIRASIPEPCSTISATKTSSTPSAIPSFHPTGSATSGEISVDGRDWRGSALAHCSASQRSFAERKHRHSMLPSSALSTDAVQKLVIKYMKLHLIAQGWRRPLGRGKRENRSGWPRHHYPSTIQP
jgi:hypothetical protein